MQIEHKLEPTVKTASYTAPKFKQDYENLNLAQKIDKGAKEAYNCGIINSTSSMGA